MIRTVAHLADIHIRSKTDRHPEYRVQLAATADRLEQLRPDRIVVAGDLFHDNITISNEAIVLAAGFLRRLAAIAPVRLIKGNHDESRKHRHRIDSVDMLVRILDDGRIVYYDTSGFFTDDNVCWVVHHHGQGINPWRDMPENHPGTGYTTIDLYHGVVNGSVSENGFSMENRRYLRTSDFRSPIAMLGDIHKRQYLKSA